MGITAVLSPGLVKQVVLEEENPGRERELPPRTVEIVSRYGAMVGADIRRYDRLARGMDEARRLIRDCEEGDQSFHSGTVILAGELAMGRGRFRRSWHAPAGGLWMTLVLVNNLLPETTRLYPLAAGVACCELLRRYNLDARIKWVNDARVAGGKIAGILTETMIGPRFGEEYILIGVGINVNNDVFPAEIVHSAVSMHNLLAVEVDIDMLAARLLAKMAWNIGLLHHDEERMIEHGGSERGNGGGSLLLSRWRELSDTIGRRVRFGFDVVKEPLYEAEVLDLDERGGLILKTAGGQTLVEYSGEIEYLEEGWIFDKGLITNLPGKCRVFSERAV